MTPSRQTRPPVGLTTPLQYVKGVGPHRAKQLEKKGLLTVGDALFHLPLRHEDRTHFTPLRAIRPGETVTCSGVVTGISPPPPGRHRQPLVILLRDDSGYATATVWGRPWVARAVQRGQRMIVHGRGARYRDKITLQVQEWETVDADDDAPIHAGALVPVYSSTEGLPQQALRSLIWRLVEAHAHEVEETLPDAVRARRRLVPLAEAVRGAHFPASEAEGAAAVRRLAFDDFLLLQLGLAILRSRTTRQRGVSMRPRGELIARLRASLPFSLTAAQERVWDDIRRDMAAPYPMHRLLQGDVGSGKTVVAALAVCAAVEAGYQAAVMAPTEILAEQHLATFRRLLEPLGIGVTLLTSGLKGRERAARRAAIAAGGVGCGIGPPALLPGPVAVRRPRPPGGGGQARLRVPQRARPA